MKQICFACLCMLAATLTACKSWSTDRAPDCVNCLGGERNVIPLTYNVLDLWQRTDRGGTNAWILVGNTNVTATGEAFAYVTWNTNGTYRIHSAGVIDRFSPAFRVDRTHPTEGPPIKRIFNHLWVTGTIKQWGNHTEYLTNEYKAKRKADGLYLETWAVLTITASWYVDATSTLMNINNPVAIGADGFAISTSVQPAERLVFRYLVSSVKIE